MNISSLSSYIPSRETIGGVFASGKSKGSALVQYVRNVDVRENGTKVLAFGRRNWKVLGGGALLTLVLASVFGIYQKKKKAAQAAQVAQVAQANEILGRNQDCFDKIEYLEQKMFALVMGLRGSSKDQFENGIANLSKHSKLKKVQAQLGLESVDYEKSKELSYLLGLEEEVSGFTMIQREESKKREAYEDLLGLFKKDKFFSSVAANDFRGLQNPKDINAIVEVVERHKDN